MVKAAAAVVWEGSGGAGERGSAGAWARQRRPLYFGEGGTAGGMKKKQQCNARERGVGDGWEDGGDR